MSAFFTAMSLLPMIVGTVQAVETAVPMPAAGKAKLDLVLGVVQSAYAVDQAIQKQLPADQLIPFVTAIVAHVVSAFNATGLFKKVK